ncbi:MAG: hypothetical protein IKQ71_05785 [Lachnospiraceae bacterium]|nr:hypothetical protein [Lachnospiraceae bacterium]
MAEEITKEIIDAIEDPESIKVLATIDRHGVPHVVAKGTISVTEDGQIRYYELLESSQTNKNVTYALWFDRQVAINIITKDKKSYQIKGIPRRSLVAGKEYEKAYVTVLERSADNDLAAVYFIEPVSVVEESYPVRLKEENEKHPLYIHIDRLAKDA